MPIAATLWKSRFRRDVEPLVFKTFEEWHELLADPSRVTSRNDTKIDISLADAGALAVQPAEYVHDLFEVVIDVYGYDFTITDSLQSFKTCVDFHRI